MMRFLIVLEQTDAGFFRKRCLHGTGYNIKMYKVTVITFTNHFKIEEN